MADAAPSTPPTARRVAVPRQLKWYHHVLAFLIYAAFRLFSMTWRCRYLDPHGFLKQPHGPTIFGIWHNRLALSMTIWERFRREAIRSTGLVALISASHDGGMLARALRFFRVEAVRGSSSRRGAQALLELTSYTERGYSIAITPDGPRGPRYEVRDGILGLAQLSGLPILPVSVQVSRKFCLKSWDRFQIPWPFARCDIFIGEPVLVPRDVTEEQREELRRMLASRMNEIVRD